MVKIERIEKIKQRIDNLRKRGTEGYAAKEDFQFHAEGDIEYLLSLIDTLQLERDTYKDAFDKISDIVEKMEPHS